MRKHKKKISKKKKRIEDMQHLYAKQDKATSRMSMDLLVWTNFKGWNRNMKKYKKKKKILHFLIFVIIFLKKCGRRFDKSNKNLPPFKWLHLTIIHKHDDQTQILFFLIGQKKKKTNKQNLFMSRLKIQEEVIPSYWDESDPRETRRHSNWNDLGLSALTLLLTLAWPWTFFLYLLLFFEARLHVHWNEVQSVTTCVNYSGVDDSAEALKSNPLLVHCD
ncbi:hypothetical protein RFI_00970 [Reticulomyxa filosa]|uniref:Uncharacterized protein n=1 Tax=Reticulomyxa filosa TaxID=46433 RepID=X6PDG1_RETFI|nr:hypothetical protein RFI_00970 [Reticulomyxa filosa]|eukprot:ETO36094.1 hypothetical protein RFI_00970 [Reticulomyxa filosa]